MSYTATGHGGSETVSDYDGGTLLIPFIDYSPTIDGIVNDAEFPEQGYLNLPGPGLLDNVKFSRNNSALFVAITVDAEEFVGFATQSKDSHGDGGTDFVYFLAGINGNQTDQLIRVAGNDYLSPETLNAINTKFVVDVQESADTRVYELMISLDDTTPFENDETSEKHEPVTDLKPRLGSLFSLIIVNGEGEDITSTDVSKSSIVPAYLLREGEDPNEIAELLKNNPSWSEVLVFPLILFSISVYFVWKYKLITVKNGGN